MKSKPVYAALELDPTAKRHLFITQGAGADAARRSLAADPAAVARILSVDGAAPTAVRDALAWAGMDTAFYIAGPEVFLWQVTGLLRDAGIEHRRIQQEVVVSPARKVYCVHCRAIQESVTTSIHRCTCCGTNLAVRDHFSKPIGAYMGVIVDAESPGDVPETEILYA